MKVALIGYGKMGKTIEALLEERGHEVVARFGRKNGIDNEILRNADVAIEFSRPKAALENIVACFEAGVPVVIGTTGWLDHYSEAVELCRQKKGAMLFASNFSLGVNIFFTLNQKLAQLMAPYPEYAVRMSETHHTEKLDAPSGTAITLAEAIIAELPHKEDWSLDSRKKESDIPIKACRVPNVPGTHEVFYENDIDRIEIKHQAFSRKGFALGAVMAAEYLKDKTGVFTMQDLLKSHQ